MTRPDESVRALLARSPKAQEVLGSCRRCGGCVTVTLVDGLSPDIIEPDPLLEVIRRPDGRLVVEHVGCGGTLRLVA